MKQRQDTLTLFLPNPQLPELVSPQLRPTLYGSEVWGGCYAEVDNQTVEHLAINIQSLLVVKHQVLSKLNLAHVAEPMSSTLEKTFRQKSTTFRHSKWEAVRGTVPVPCSYRWMLRWTEGTGAERHHIDLSFGQIVHVTR